MNLADEIWGCFKYIGIPMETLKKMPTKDRKYYIQRHNADIDKEKGNTNLNKTNIDLNSFAELSQQNQINSKR